MTPILPGGAPSDLLVIQSPAGPGDVNATVALSVNGGLLIHSIPAGSFEQKGTTSVPLMVEKDTVEEQELEFKRSPKLRCQAPPPDDPNDDLRSCLSFMEVTHLPGTVNAEPIEKFSDEIGHPSTDFVAADGSAADFDTSCSQCLTCGQLDPSSAFEITGISDATDKMAAICGVPDASCGVAPPTGP